MNLENCKVSVPELRQLLCDVKVLRPDIGVRLRLLGDLWQQYYFLILRIGENDLTLKEEHSDRSIHIPDFNLIVQFELSNTFKQYQPHFHYSVANSLPDSKSKLSLQKKFES